VFEADVDGGCGQPAAKVLAAKVLAAAATAADSVSSTSPSCASGKDRTMTPCSSRRPMMLRTGSSSRTGTRIMRAG
jgi:hypothetical protein